MKRVLVTGGSGRLGQELVPQLRAAGYIPRVMSRRAAPAEHRPGVEWVQANLKNGAGLGEALDGAQFVIHTASNLAKPRVDVEGTGLLLEEAKKAGIDKFVYISIVGIEQIDFGYYKNKLAAERLIEAAGVPWAIQRATQFHSFVDWILRSLTILPVAVLPSDWQFQSISEAEVAQRLIAAVEGRQAGRLPDIGGPEILSLDEMARQWLAAQSLQRRIVHCPIPGGLSAGFRRGLNTTPEGRAGKITWGQWLAARYAAGPENEAIATAEGAGGG
jgi:uncharacterized protein YbjT (DUF2867 family)